MKIKDLLKERVSVNAHLDHPYAKFSDDQLINIIKKDDSGMKFERILSGSGHFGDGEHLKLSDKVLLVGVTDIFWGLGLLSQNGFNVTDELRQAALNADRRAIIYIDLSDITPEMAKHALLDQNFIKRDLATYNEFVRKYFANNQLLMNKWLRYAETVSGTK